MASDGSQGRWSRIEESFGLRPEDLLWQSPFDQCRRTYAADDRIYKIQLLPSQTAGKRALDLEGEREVLTLCADIDGVPSPLEYERGPDYELLVLRRVHGASLAEQTPSLPSFLTTLTRLAWILCRMSRRGISHNDIRPENVLVDEGGRVVLVDFDQATRAAAISALLSSFVGTNPGPGISYHSLLTVIKRYLAKKLPPTVKRPLRRLIHPPNYSRHTLPNLPTDEDPEVLKLHAAWKLAQTSGASSPGQLLAYYSLNVDGLNFPGERPWHERWDSLRSLTDYRGKRVLELGCNMALLSCFLLKDGGASEAVAVDVDARILKSAELVAEALGVRPQLRRVDFDADADWEAPLSESKPDIVFALNVLNWVKDKQRFMRFLARFNEVVFEGHDPPAVEVERFRSAGFADVTIVGISERQRPLLHCRK